MNSSHDWYLRYAPFKRRLEVGFWLLVFGVTAVANTVTRMMDAERFGMALGWEPLLWESSSALSMLLLIPVLVWFTARFPLSWRDWRRLLAIYLLASVAFSVAHVLLMVGMRHAAFALLGGDYAFGPWPRQLWYEYLKDFRTFFAIVLVIEGWRALLRRLQGEARLLDAPDDAPVPESEPPARRFLVKMLGREFLIPADGIAWAQAAGNYVNLRSGDREYPLRSTLSGLLQRLDPDRFVQVHRSWLVNLEQVVAIEPLESGDANIHMQGGHVIPCSRRYRDALRARLPS